MAFCGSCGAGLSADVKFCSTCGSGANPSKAGNHLKPSGIVMLVIGGIALGIGFKWYYSDAHQTLVNMLGGRVLADPVLLIMIVYGLAAGVLGIMMLRSKPRVFLRLSRPGLIVFVALYAGAFVAGWLPALCWVPWLVPGLKQRPEQH